MNFKLRLFYDRRELWSIADFYWCDEIWCLSNARCRSASIISNTCTYIARSLSIQDDLLARRTPAADTRGNLIITRQHLSSHLFALSSTFRVFVCRKSKIPPQILGKISAAILPPLYHRRHNLFRPTNANVLGTANPLLLSSELDVGEGIEGKIFTVQTRISKNLKYSSGIQSSPNLYSFLLPEVGMKRNEHNCKRQIWAFLILREREFNYLFFKIISFVL